MLSIILRKATFHKIISSVIFWWAKLFFHPLLRVNIQLHRLAVFYFAVKFVTEKYWFSQKKKLYMV